MKRNKPELLAPAGSWAALTTSVANGADSVYFGVKDLNMRHLASNFEISEIKKIMVSLHEKEKKGYLTLNTIVMTEELPKVKKILKVAKAADVDAVILWDMAVLKLAKEAGLRVHISTQASISNIEAVKYYAKLSASRIVLARECTLKDIKKIIQGIKKENIKCEIETFIHGAMCISISGRCFLSEYSFGKSANKGQCMQPCRREFYIKDVDGEAEYMLGKDYVLSPKDLCTIDFIDELIKMGVAAFKIEGRIRASEYTKVVTSVYREAIDAYYEERLGDFFKARLKTRLMTVYNRGFSSGFYFGHPQNACSRGLEHIYEKIFLGEVTRFFKRIGVAEIRLRNRSLSVGEHLLFIGRTTPANDAIVGEMQVDNKFVKKVKKGASAGIKLPFVVKPRDKVFLWQKKFNQGASVS